MKLAAMLSRRRVYLLLAAGVLLLDQDAPSNSRMVSITPFGGEKPRAETSSAKPVAVSNAGSAPPKEMGHASVSDCPG